MKDPRKGEADGAKKMLIAKGAKSLKKPEGKRLGLSGRDLLP